MAKRKKHAKLPNGYGSIRYLGKGRRNPYAVHPPAKEDDETGAYISPRALCYVPSWYAGLAVLTAYHAGTYTPGMENDLVSSTETVSGLDNIADRLLSDFTRIRFAKTAQGHTDTFADIYQGFYANKFPDGHTYSKSTVTSTSYAYKHCASLHNQNFWDLRADDLQAVIDNCPKKHATLELIVNLIKQMYDYADGCGKCEKRYDSFIKIKRADDDEHGTSFTDEELEILWRHASDDTVKVILILCYSGWRISEYQKASVNLSEDYLQGGAKTRAGKNRIVPIHPRIRPLLTELLEKYGRLLPSSPPIYRNIMYQTLTELGIPGNPKHTPHDCRHTFSRLCEKYNVKENDRKRMLGHAFTDVTNKIYGHRDLEDLKKELQKIL